MNEIDATVAEQEERTRARLSMTQDVVRDDASARRGLELEESEAGEGYRRELDAGGDLAGLGRDDADVYAAAKVGAQTGDGELEYDSEGDVIGVRGGSGEKKSQLLPHVDHALIKYPPFTRVFLPPSGQATATGEDAVAVRAELRIRVEGVPPLPAPARSFMHLGLAGTFGTALLSAIAGAGFEAPTAIQSQAIPAALAGRDVLALASTGSGKTLAYLLPLLRHVTAAAPLESGDGPIALILAPTRELATQVHTVARRFAKAVGHTAVLCGGGTSKWEQRKALEAGAEIVIATPGRLVDLASDK